MLLQSLRSSLKAILGINDPGTSVSFRTISTEDRGEYDQHVIEYEGHEHDTIPAYLLVPKGIGPFPGILIHHQHHQEWHLGKSEVCGIKGDPLNAFGPELARSGMVVLSPDSIGFEDRRRNQKGNERNEKTDWLQYYNGMAYRLVQGRMLISTVMNDALIGVSVLRHHPSVNPANVGIMGHSYGGNTSIFHGAVDERVKYVCASGSACSFGYKMEHETGLEMSLVIPGVANKTDIHEFVACMSPKDVLLVSADEDIYSMDAPEIVERAHAMLVELNAPDHLEHRRYEGGHQLTEERFAFIIDWVKRAVSR